MVHFETRCLSSLSKVFADEELKDTAFSSASALRGESYSFQVAYRCNKGIRPLEIKLESTIQGNAYYRLVGLSPSDLPCFDDFDENVLRSTPGMYPDPLYTPEVTEAAALPNQWRSVWITVEIDPNALEGSHSISVQFEDENKQTLGREVFHLNIIPATLPPQRLLRTEWFHADCLADYYKCPILSEEHWKRISQFMQTAAKHGMNMILTPLFTLPLDTEMGGERPTLQLVKIFKSGDHYRFEFDQLKRWIDLCNIHRIQYVEFSHLFTQWGAEHAPKIMADVSGQSVQIFGWETDSTGEEYTLFLNQFLPELVSFIKEEELTERCYFHVSDEPYLEHMDTFKQVSQLIKSHLEGFPIFDALSNYEFYTMGLVETPVVAIDHIDVFIKNEVPSLWAYYCVSQRQKVSNRFFHMPSARNRMIGIQLYKFAIKGFLHWGYNFYFSQFSRKSIDPFRVTDADQRFPSGDSFIVYPGPSGPIESIRLEVMLEAMQDIRAFELLESYIGKDQVIKMIEEGLDHPITFSEYPHSLDWLLEVRNKVNQAISVSAGKQVHI